MVMLGLIGLGFGLGLLFSYLLTVRELIKSLQRMYYDGFRVSPIPPRPKTVPDDPTRRIRED